MASSIFISLPPLPTGMERNNIFKEHYGDGRPVAVKSVKKAVCVALTGVPAEWWQSLTVRMSLHKDDKDGTEVTENTHDPDKFPYVFARGTSGAPAKQEADRVKTLGTWTGSGVATIMFEFGLMVLSTKQTGDFFLRFTVQSERGAIGAVDTEPFTSCARMCNEKSDALPDSDGGKPVARPSLRMALAQSDKRKIDALTAENAALRAEVEALKKRARNEPSGPAGPEHEPPAAA